MLNSRFWPTQNLPHKPERHTAGSTSQDFEDIVSVLNNRGKIWEEMETAPEPLKYYLKEEFQSLRSTDDHYEWISAHLDFAEQRRADRIIGGLITFVES